MRWLLVSLALLLFIFSAIQLNDPDPIYWTLVYGCSGFVVLGKGLGHFNRTWAAVALGAAIAGILIAAPGFEEFLLSGNYGRIFGDMAGSQDIESAREFLGLTLTILVILWCMRR